MAFARRKEAFHFGGNLWAYATDKRPLRDRLARKGRAAARAAYRHTSIRGGPGGEVTLARVKHGGDYYVGRNYDGPNLLAKAIRACGGPSLLVADDVEVADLKPDQVAWLTGRQGVALSEDKIKALTRYLDGGGFLLAEAILGDKRFDASFRELAKAAGLELKMLPPGDGLLTGRIPGASGYAIRKVHFKRTLLAERIGKLTPELYGIYRGGKMVGVYSPFDLMHAQTGLDAWDNRGYETEDARAILTNILLWASAR
jgi:hypothetical protein